MKDLIKKFALENAVKFKGKANPGAVIGSCIKEDPNVKEDMKSLSKQVNEIVKKVNSMKLETQKKELKALAPELLKKKKGKKKGIFDSFKPEGKVVTAFPPEPSKYMHIGHAKAFFINYEFSKHFKGKFILRFEDTNPELAKKEYYEQMIKDVEWLEVKPDKIEYASDYMDEFIKYATKLINLGKAYVCTCTQEKVKESRMKGKPCDCRYQHIRENLILWNQMPNMDEGDAILRLKIDLKF